MIYFCFFEFLSLSLYHQIIDLYTRQNLTCIYLFFFLYGYSFLFSFILFFFFFIYDHKTHTKNTTGENPSLSMTLITEMSRGASITGHFNHREATGRLFSHLDFVSILAVR